MTTNELSIQRLKNLSSEELSDVLAIVSSEIRPVVQAYNNYHYSDVLETYVIDFPTPQLANKKPNTYL